jgi:hypothetical protein
VLGLNLSRGVWDKAMRYPRINKSEHSEVALVGSLLGCVEVLISRRQAGVCCFARKRCKGNGRRSEVK